MKEELQGLILINSTKKDGNMAVKYGEDADSNRQRFLSKMGLSQNRFLFMQPDNGDDVVELKEDILKEENLYYQMVKADAVICRYPNIYLYLSFGDCIPFTIYDREQHIFAFAHLGWRSTYLNLHQKLFSIFRTKYHSKIEDLIVHIGPCIKKESYLLPDPKQKEDVAWKPYVAHVKDEFYSIDLVGYVTDFFKKQGLIESQIHVVPVDTGTGEMYFSHYRSTHFNEPEQRFLCGAGMSKKES